MTHKHLFVTFLLSLTLQCSCSGSKDSEKSLSYSPWVDLSEHFDLSSVKVSESGLRSFNSLDISYNKQLYAAKRLDNAEYNATVLGSNLLLRSQPIISNSTRRAYLNTGDKLTVMRPIGFMNGKYWDYVYVNTGYSMGCEGYVCSDFIVSQEQAVHPSSGLKP